MHKPKSHRRQVLINAIFPRFAKLNSILSVIVYKQNVSRTSTRFVTSLCPEYVHELQLSSRDERYKLHLQLVKWRNVAKKR